MRVLQDRFDRTIHETEPDIWEMDGLRLEAYGMTEQQVIDAFNVFAPTQPDVPITD